MVLRSFPRQLNQVEYATILPKRGVLFFDFVEPFKIAVTNYGCRSKNPIAWFEKTHVEYRVGKDLRFTSSMERKDTTYLFSII
jgi:hypothetical protein